MIDILINIARSQPPSAWFVHAQLGLFWLIAKVTEAIIFSEGMPDRVCRLFLALYPLLPVVSFVVACGYAAAARHAYLLAALVYGCHLTVLFNPQEMGWVPHVLLLQCYYSVAALWANEGVA